MPAKNTQAIREEKSASKKEFAKALAEKVKAARIKKGMSQEELAHLAGYYRTYIGHIETATYSPSVHTVWRIAKALEVDLGDLLKNL